jgi:hypothetical protein
MLRWQEWEASIIYSREQRDWGFWWLAPWKKGGDDARCAQEWGAAWMALAALAGHRGLVGGWFFPMGIEEQGDAAMSFKTVCKCVSFVLVNLPPSLLSFTRWIRGCKSPILLGPNLLSQQSRRKVSHPCRHLLAILNSHAKLLRLSYLQKEGRNPE